MKPNPRKNQIKLTPHRCTDAWWYEESSGILVYHQPQGEEPRFVVSIPWETLLAAAERCGKLKR